MNAYLTAPAVTLQYALTRSLGFPPTKGLLLWTYIEESCEDVEIDPNTVADLTDFDPKPDLDSEEREEYGVLNNLKTHDKGIA